MDLKQENLQFLRIFGIFRETCKLVHAGRRIFSQITLAAILPLWFLIFAGLQFPNLFLPKHSHIFFFEWNHVIDAFLFYFASFFSSIIFFFLSTSAVVYTVACIYTGRDVAFNQVILVAPKVFKGHLITFLCIMVDFFAFNIVALTALLLISMVVFNIPLVYGQPYEFHMVLLILFFSAESFYFSLIWQMASVVSVLEDDSYGFEAIARSKELLKGKMAMAVTLLLLVGFPFGVVQVVFHHLVVRSKAIGVASRGILGTLWMVSFLLFVLIELVMRTVVYFVCKSYQRQSIDMSALSAHLQAYLPIDCESSKGEDEDAKGEDDQV